MTKKNRLNPDPTSRTTLRSLETKGILKRERVGIRHIIRAATNTVDRIGYNLGELHGRLTSEFLNFHPGVQVATAWVSYDGGRAEITATQGFQGHENHILDVSRHFPVNQLATKLFGQECTKVGSYNAGLPMHGDATLVTDIRAHWLFRTWRSDVQPDDIEEFDCLLKSPRDLIRSGGRRLPWIFFHEEPCHEDIVALKLRWQ
jgi:hypothetical protein